MLCSSINLSCSILFFAGLCPTPHELLKKLDQNFGWVGGKYGDFEQAKPLRHFICP